MGRLTKDPEVRYSQGEKSMAIAKIIDRNRFL
jgi:single-stranded DNA-binding protein